MLEVNIKKQMPGFEVTADFTCARSELVALTGPSGAGKTTIIRILAGLETADEGYIRFQGTTWFDSSLNINLRPQSRGIGYVFQDHTLFPHLTVMGNIGFIEKDKKKLEHLLTMFSIRHIADRKPHQISGGERQRAAFAQALASDPQVLLLDEPFSALDTVTRNRLQYELKKLKQSLALPIIHVTHDLAEADYLCDSKVNIDRNFSSSCLCIEKENKDKAGLFKYPVNMQGTLN